MMSERPATPQFKRVLQFYENIIEERDDVLRNVEKIACIAENQKQNLLKKSQASISKQQALTAFLAKIVSLFSEINCLVSSFLESEKPPFPLEPNNTNFEEQCLNGSINQELQECLKQRRTSESNSFSSNIFNEDCNNGVLKTLTDVISTDDSTTTLIPTENDGSLTSPTLSFNGSVLTTSSAYPLEEKLASPTKNQEKLRENMKFISIKMGFTDFKDDRTSEDVATSRHLDLINLEPSSKIIELQEEINNDKSTEILENPNNLDLLVSSETNDVPKIPEINDLPNNVTNSLPKYLNGPLPNTGAIRKHTSVPELYLDTPCNGTMSQSESCEKVNSWLGNNTGSLGNIQADISPIDNVVKKLHQVKRYDIKETAKEEYKATMPDIKFVPYIPPPEESDGSSSGRSRKNKSKLKKINKDFEIPPMESPVEGDTCVFTHIVSPYEFFLQIINPLTTSSLDLIWENLNKMGQTTKSFVSKQEAYSKIGKYCYGYISGKNESGQWFRLQVLDWKLDTVSDVLTVQAIDYGFTSNISYKCLRELTLNLAKIPKLAIKCHFPLLYPIGSTPTNLLSHWPKTTIDVLYDMANLHKEPLDAVTEEDVRLFQIIFACKIEDSLGVDLIRVPADGGDSMGSEIMEMGLAKEITDTETDPNLIEMLWDLDELEAADNPNEYFLGYDARDEERVCKFTTPDGRCYKGKNCTKEHVQLKDGYTTDKSPTYFITLKDLILPQKHDEIQVLVTEYIDSCTYTVQMVRNPVNYENENSNIIIDKDLDDLMKTMNNPKIVGTYVPFKVLPAIGELILAYNPIAKKWMRMVVRDFEDIDPVFIEVSPIDFGGDFKISIKNIRKMKNEFMHLPCQTFQIYLDNYQHKETCDNRKANKFFEKHIFYKSFIARILTHELPFKVKLMTLKGNDIGPTLVKEGFAEQRTVDWYLSDDKSLRGGLILD